MLLLVDVVVEVDVEVVLLPASVSVLAVVVIETVWLLSEDGAGREDTVVEGVSWAAVDASVSKAELSNPNMVDSAGSTSPTTEHQVMS